MSVLITIAESGTTERQYNYADLCKQVLANVNGSTVGECLNYFVEQFPSTKKLLLHRDGGLLGHLDVYVSGVSTYPEELGKPDLPPISVPLTELEFRAS